MIKYIVKKINFRRIMAMAGKEFVQLKRDKATFGMILGIPIMQLLLFGTVVNSDPHNIPSVIVPTSNTPLVRSITQGLINSNYYKVIDSQTTTDQADLAISRGKANIAITFEEEFDRKLFRRQQPAILVEADSSDPITVSNALANLDIIVADRIAKSLPATVKNSFAAIKPYRLVIHRLYNPENVNNYNTIPGMIGVVLTMTMIMMTAMAIVREKERGNMENLLATPVSGVEVMLGKIIPYILIGLVQVLIILAVSFFIFGVPFSGNPVGLFFCVMIFIVVNLSLGLTISTFVSNQLQALQISFFIFLPSILLSGFMFPFQGMPLWAQYLGEILPLTHFLRLIRSIILKGSSIWELSYDLMFLVGLMLAALVLAILKFKNTLD